MQDKNFELLDLLMRSCTNSAMSHDPSMLYDSVLQLCITIRPYINDREWLPVRKLIEDAGKELLHDNVMKDTPGQRRRQSYIQNGVYSKLIVIQADIYKLMTPIIRMMLKKSQGIDDLYKQLGVERKEPNGELKHG
jgi:hypothetical protein